MAVLALPTPPSGYVAAQGTSSMSQITPYIKVQGRAFLQGSGILNIKTKTQSPTFFLVTSTSSAISPILTMRSITPFVGGGTWTNTSGIEHNQQSFDGGFHMDGFGRLDVAIPAVVPSTLTVRNLLAASLTMQTPVMIGGKPVMPTTVGTTTSPASTAGTYTINSAPAPSSTAHVLPVTPVWRWLATDVVGNDGANFTTWPEHSGIGPSFTASTAFAPTIISLSHYDTYSRSNIDMGRCVNFYWRYAQHMAMVMDAAHQMTTTATPFTMQFVLLAYPMTSRQYQHIWDCGVVANDGYYTDPNSGSVELISDAVYANKDVQVPDGQGGRCYFGLRPNKVETLFNNTPHIARLTTASVITSRPFVYTVIFNGGAASKVRIRGYGVNETYAADTKTSIVNDFLLGRVQNCIGPASSSHMSVWEMAYFNRALTEAELGVNSHWLGGVYKFNKYH